MGTKSPLVDPAQYNSLLERVDFLCLEASRKLKANRAGKRQFFIPQKVARFMARMFTGRPSTLKILDAGAGIGSLSAALVLEACQWNPKPSVITVTAYEIDPALVGHLHVTLNYRQEVFHQEGVCFEYEVIQGDFIQAAVEALSSSALFPLSKSFNATILNPPYRKIDTHSATRGLLRKVRIKTTNLYTAFLWLTIRLLEPNGELVAITPRSFCSGPYFFPFREEFLKMMSVNRIHVFDYRDRAFKDDDVLQENVTIHAIRAHQQERVTISSSSDPNDSFMTVREVGYAQLVRPDDPNQRGIRRIRHERF